MLTVVSSSLGLYTWNGHGPPGHLCHMNQIMPALVCQKIALLLPQCYAQASLSESTIMHCFYHPLVVTDASMY